MRDLLLIFLLVAILITAGCIQSHSREFTNANSLIESGTSRITPLVSSNFTSADLADIRVKTTAAKVNFSEAMNILDRIPSKDLNNKDQLNLNAMKSLINANVKISDLLASNFSDVIQYYRYKKDAPVSCDWIAPYHWEIIDPFADNVSKIKSDLLSIKSDIATINISMDNDFNKFNYNDLSPSVLQNYNETANRLIRFDNNIDNLIKALESPRSKISCPLTDFVLDLPQRYCSSTDWDDPECIRQAMEYDCRKNADAWINGQCRIVGGPR